MMLWHEVKFFITLGNCSFILSNHISKFEKEIFHWRERRRRKKNRKLRHNFYFLNQTFFFHVSFLTSFPFIEMKYSKKKKEKKFLTLFTIRNRRSLRRAKK